MITWPDLHFPPINLWNKPKMKGINDITEKEWDSIGNYTNEDRLKLLTSLQRNKQVGGDHYKNMPIQPVEFITKNNIPFIEGNIIKYICRHASKNGKQDLEKAKHFIDLLIELRY